MMKAAKSALAIAAILAAMTLSTGCERWQALSASASSFGLGWVLGDLAAATRAESTCYLNGELIDCADLPTNVAQR